MNIPAAAIEAAAEALNVAGVRALSGAHSLYRRGIARRAIEAAMPAIREALAQEVYGIPVIDSEGQRRDGSRMRATAGRIVRGGTP